MTSLLTPDPTELERSVQQALFEAAGKRLNQSGAEHMRNLVRRFADTLPSLITAARERDELKAELRLAQAAMLILRNELVAERDEAQSALEDLQGEVERLREALTKISKTYACIASGSYDAMGESHEWHEVEYVGGNPAAIASASLNPNPEAKP